MARSTAIHDRVAEAILDAAADLLAADGEPPSLTEVAAAAGVGRATLYPPLPPPPPPGPPTPPSPPPPPRPPPAASPPSLTEVAAAAGVARATLYRHFPTRER